jgi:Polyketide cyclase / dehydrase and lipid transport
LFYKIEQIMSEPLKPPLVYEQSIVIRSDVAAIEQCFANLDLMHQWLNPALRCIPMDGVWSTNLGAQSRFVIQVPFWQPMLGCTVIERTPGLIVWGFDGFFQGCDRWQCIPEGDTVRLLNRFEFTVPNPLIAFGFQTFAAPWTQRDMKAQLQRLQVLAERVKG